MTARQSMNEPARAAKAWKDFNLRFQPDAMVDPVVNSAPAGVFEALDYRLYAWPGHGVADDASFQYIEQEWMLPEEYDHLISDPVDYILRAYMPRVAGAWSGFSKLSSPLDVIELSFLSGSVAGWGTPEVVRTLERLLEAARLHQSWASTILPAVDDIEANGFPRFTGCGTKAPFDILGDTLRGTRGVIIDMFRCPERVIAACERLVPVAIDWALKRSTTPVSPLVFMPLHKGADGFMSEEQFNTFYWPTLRAVLLGLIEEGMIPFPIAEGRYGTRLETIADLPKGKTLWLFDQTDMARVKQTVGRVACIEGNLPLSLIHAGSPEEVAGYTRQLIDTAGEGGGYILSIGASADEGKVENLEAMIRTAREYGVY